MRIPSLDGLRAISISLVIFWHFNALPIPGLWRVDYGNLGVRVFFVISGFLITSLLMKEESNLKTFYVRRFARIMPAYWVYLLAIAVLIPHVQAHYKDLLPSFFYLTDYASVGLALGATWSLSVEEQFYLLWPSLRRWAVPVCFFVLLAAPLFRVGSDLGHWHTNPRYAFESVCDALASGCLLAIFRDRLPRLPYAPAYPFVVLALLAFSGTIAHDLLLTPLNLSIAAAMAYLIEKPPKWLNSAPLVWVGTLSYSLYLWQQPFAGTGLAWWAKMGGTLACACASFYLVEKPARRWINAFVPAGQPPALPSLSSVAVSPLAPEGPRPAV
jgi:peptidoglycan/LPS O-acetylase OafA/YrhL